MITSTEEMSSHLSLCDDKFGEKLFADIAKAFGPLTQATILVNKNLIMGTFLVDEDELNELVVNTAGCNEKSDHIDVELAGDTCTKIGIIL